jgi:hypothetical protein
LDLLNLCADLVHDGPKPFESLYFAVRYLFAAEAHSYEIARAIAQAAKRSGLEGVMYPSYFSSLESDAGELIPNIALFGHPVEAGIVRVRSINRLRIKSVRYGIQLGPLLLAE